MNEETPTHGPLRVIHKHRVRHAMQYMPSAVVIKNLTLHEHAEIISVVSQTDQVFLYEQHSVTTRKMATREFMVVGTGHEFNVSSDRVLKFIATVQGHDGYVWHVYEVKKY